MADAPLCGCGTYAIGVCKTCTAPVCGTCSVMANGIRECRVHVAERRREAERASNEAAIARGKAEAAEREAEEEAWYDALEEVPRLAAALARAGAPEARAFHNAAKRDRTLPRKFDGWVVGARSVYDPGQGPSGRTPGTDARTQSWDVVVTTTGQWAQATGTVGAAKRPGVVPMEPGRLRARTMGETQVLQFSPGRAVNVLREIAERHRVHVS